MSSKGMTKSAATIRVKSNVRVKKISPESAPSVGMTLSRDSALEMARNLMILVSSVEIRGDIVITGHPRQGVITILGYKAYQHGKRIRVAQSNRD